MRPLSGIRVLDLTRVLAGPFAAMLLGDLGAEVIKVEQPGRGDDARGFGPFKDGVSGYFMSVNRGKRGMTLDLKHPKGKDILRELVKQSDVLVENFRPGVMARLGLSYDALSQVNPRLIYAATSGFGQTGPYSGKAAYDMIVQGMSGIMSITGQPDGEPARVGTSIADLSAALFTVTGVLAALYSRERTGRGQMVDVAMLDSVVALLENAVVRCVMTGETPKPLGARHPAITPFELFKSKDGHVILALSNEAQWQKFIAATDARELAAPEFATNPLRTENHDKLKPLMDAVMARKTTAEWIAQMEQIGIACGPLNTVADLFSNPQIQARSMLVEVAHATAGRFTLAACPVRLSDGEPSTPPPAPDLGEHTDEILTRLLGFTPAHIAGLRRDGVV